MNLQQLMKQAQSMQKNMLDSKKKIESKIYEEKTELVDIKMNGKKILTEVKIKNKESIEPDDLEVLEDMFMIAVNNAVEKINKDIKNSNVSRETLESSLLINQNENKQKTIDVSRET